MRPSPKTIVEFRFEEVVVPANPGSVNSPGYDKPLHMLPVGGKAGWSVQFDELPKLILQLKLADGTIGWGEFYRDHNWATIEGVVPNLLGRTLDELSLQDLPIPLSREYDGFECAIWDAEAKSLDIPLHKLLGGAVRDAVKVGSWSSYRVPGEMSEVAKQFQAQGYDCIKLKAGLDDDVVGWCEEIKANAPGMWVIIDPNQRWENAGEARRRLRALDAIGNLMLIEDPIPRWMLQDYARLRNFTATPVVLHLSLPYVYQGQRPYDAINAIAHGAVDGFNFNCGLAKFRDLDAIAHTANLPCWHGSEVDLGILEAMYVHQAAAARSCTWPSDIFGRMIRSHDLLETPLAFEPPFVRLPQGPGLGVTPSREAIDRFKTGERVFTL
ncbi:MAG: mandelate racemase [Devosia sp.]|uniref:mandelate racemase/muconate lactonizing enzyme family protein n=1 Tax=Devosia sp. TaxID=1871048 RepID=UPI00261A7EF7|nr:enolase C-terminal domain-like protein [Devosia sp.]MDB5585932.1 mandelate racemase [Devosia sp.]